MARRNLQFEVRAVTLTAGRRRILRDIALTVADGDVLALVGRNGAGKSTLLSVMAGRLRPDVGDVRLLQDGRPLAGGELRSRVVWLPHELLIYPDLTAIENLRLTASLYSARDDAGGLSKTLAAVGLRHASDKVARAFSRGMLQRLAVARLIVSGAPLWLMDEPMTGLDEPGRHWLKETIGNHKLGGGLVVFSSHVRSEVTDCANRVALIEGGRVTFEGAVSAGGVSEAFGRLEVPA